MELEFERVRGYFEKYLPLGDRLGECFYAVWMVVVSLGLLGNIVDTRGDVLAIVAVAFSVNVVWGLIDGLTVMYGDLINRAVNDRIVHSLRVRNDLGSRDSAVEALDGTIAAGLSREQKERIINEIASGAPGQDPFATPYRPAREDWYYALGIVAIDVLIAIPLVAPILLAGDLKDGIYWSRLIATAMMALLGAAYAKHLNRKRWWAAALFLATLGFALFSMSYAAGW